MSNGRSYIRGFLRYLHVQNKRGCSKTFETYILQVLCGQQVHEDFQHICEHFDENSFGIHFREDNTKFILFVS